MHVCNLMVFTTSLGLLRKMPMVLQLGRAVEAVFLKFNFINALKCNQFISDSLILKF